MYDDLFANVSKFYTYDPDDSTYDYALFEISGAILEQFKNYITNVFDFEEKKQIITCMRGFSKGNHNEHFIHCDLNKIFMVGEKGKWFLNEEVKGDIYTEDYDDKDRLFENIKKLIEDINKKIETREKNGHEISGNIKIEDLHLKENLRVEELRFWKLFLSIVLHNIGNGWRHKKESPFVSVTYGEKKQKVAYEFAFSREEKDVQNGFIYLAFLEKKSPYFMYTKHINEILRNLGVNWYEDINNEIILIDGLFPHYIIGIFEVYKNSDNRIFYINPWLYRKFKMNNHVAGNLRSHTLFTPKIPINQKEFKSFAKELGYHRYFSTSYDNARRELNDYENRYIGISAENSFNNIEKEE